MKDGEVTYFPWNEGAPTKPDVDALLAAFPPESIKPGQWKATDDEIRAVIGRADGTRYRTVYSTWIRRLARDHAINVYREKEIGFYCPTPEQVFSTTHPTLESARRKVGRQLRSVNIVKAENDLQRSTQEASAAPSICHKTRAKEGSYERAALGRSGDSAHHAAEKSWKLEGEFEKHVG